VGRHWGGVGPNLDMDPQSAGSVWVLGVLTKPFWISYFGQTFPRDFASLIAVDSWVGASDDGSKFGMVAVLAYISKNGK
jgi:hypothetical protein